MIKVVIFDGDGTLQLPAPSQEMRDLVESFPTLGLSMAIASNGSRRIIERRFSTAGFSLPEVIVTPKELGGLTKASPEFIYRIRDELGVQLNEIMFVGDDDKTDIFCAINAGVLPINAKYSDSGKPQNYGLHITSPERLAKFLRTFAKQQEPYFGWTYKNALQNVDIRALLGDQGNIRNELKLLLKEQRDFQIGSERSSARLILFLSFMSQFYMSGVAREVNWVTVYPGHATGRYNQFLGDYLSKVSHMFRNSFKDDLLVRYKDAPKSQYQGTARSIFDQFNTIHINPNYRKSIEGKTIAVLDDFTTSGYSLETARQMLLKAGAEKVIGLAIAKFRVTHSVSNIGSSWDPFAPCTLDREDIRLTDQRGDFHSSADHYFHDGIWAEYNK